MKTEKEGMKEIQALMKDWVFSDQPLKMLSKINKILEECGYAPIDSLANRKRK